MSGPTLAAQFGFAPGLIWLVAGAVLAGCVHDLTALIGSLRHDGKSLPYIVQREVGPCDRSAGHDCRTADPHRSHGRPRHHRGQRAEPERLGHLHHRLDHPDRHGHGRLDVSRPRRQSSRARPVDLRYCFDSRCAGRRSTGSPVRNTRTCCSSARIRSSSSSAATDFWPQCCPSGCCWSRAITCLRM